MELDLGETVGRRAGHEFRRRFSGWWAVLAVTVAGAAGSLGAARLVPGTWSGEVQGVVIAASAPMAVALLLAGVLFALFSGAPKCQRDEARRRLKKIKKAAASYSIVADQPSLAPHGQGSIVRVPIRNQGRGAHFGVVIEELQGTEEPLLDRYAHVHWQGRIGVVDEEIPTDEGRLVDIGYLRWNIIGEEDPAQSRFEFKPMNPEAEVGGRGYFAQPGTITIWLRVSARQVAEVGYAKRIGVTVKWLGRGQEVFVGLAPIRPTLRRRPTRHPSRRYSTGRTDGLRVVVRGEQRPGDFGTPSDTTRHDRLSPIVSPNPPRTTDRSDRGAAGR